jgi:hypothetical protein
VSKAELKTLSILFPSDSPTVAFSKAEGGKIKLRSQSIDGEPVVPDGHALVVTLGKQGVEGRVVPITVIGESADEPDPF